MQNTKPKVKLIKADVFELSDANSNVVYPTPVGDNQHWILKKLGVLFGTRCPKCYSTNWEYSFGNLGKIKKHCQDCDHRWGKPPVRYDP